MILCHHQKRKGVDVRGRAVVNCTEKMCGYLFMIRLIKQHHNVMECQQMLTTLMLLTSDFVEQQSLVLRLVIIEYFFNATTWPQAAAIANIDDTIKSSKLKLELVTACSEWDRQNMFLSKGDK